jgi:AbrB family looped-hinge helix DNA binding protein
MINPTKHIQNSAESSALPFAFYDAVTVGERGQIVIPQAAREIMDIKPGSKLLVMGGKIPAVQGLFIIKADAVGGILRDMIGHLGGLEEYLKQDGGQA